MIYAYPYRDDTLKLVSYVSLISIARIGVVAGLDAGVRSVIVIVLPASCSSRTALFSISCVNLMFGL